MKCCYCLLLILCPCITPAQTAAVKPLAVGDQVPDIFFTQMINHSATSANLSEFKGKLVLLDFWATWCGNCIKKFNMLDSMQGLYPGKLQVILVNTADTRDSGERIEKFLNRQKNAGSTRFAMPVVYNDTLAAALFPHTYIPHYVWLGQNRRILAITGEEAVTAHNIQMLLNNREVTFSGTAGSKRFDFSQPFFTGDDMDEAHMQYRSTLLNYVPGLHPDFRLIKEKYSVRYTFINMPLRYMIRAAWNINFEKDRVLLHVSDSMLPKLSADTGTAINENSCCYEFIGPSMPLKQVQVYMQQDMQRWFGLAIKKDTLPAPCYILTVDTKLLSKFRTSGAAPANKLYDRDKKHMINQPLAILVRHLDKILDKKLVQKAAIDFNLDIDLTNMPAGNFTSLQQYLATFGIFLTPATETTEQYIIFQTPKQKLL